MKFFLVSKCGEGAHLLHRIGEEGNDVRMYIKEKDYRSVWSGMIDQIGLHDVWVDRETIIIFDSSGMGPLADGFRKWGHRVFGASSYHDRLENDRGFGLDVMRDCGIKVPQTFRFSSDEWSKARDFLSNRENKKFVFKPSGELPSHLTYCPCDQKDLILYMDFVQGKYGREITDFILQEFIDGTIVSSEYWCDGTRFIGPVSHTVEVKKFMDGDLGPSTGCSGNLVWFGDDESELALQGVKKAEKRSVDEHFVGPLDLNVIFNDSGVFGLEWTPRFGLDALPTWLQLLNVDLGKLIADVTLGQLKGDMEVRQGFLASGVRLSIPPYPLEPKYAVEVQKTCPNKGVPLRGFPDIYRDNYYFYEIMEGDSGFEHSDGTGVIAVISDKSDEDNPEESLSLPYEILEETKVPNKQYRTDLGRVLPEMYFEVKESSKCLT